MGGSLNVVSEAKAIHPYASRSRLQILRSHFFLNRSFIADGKFIYFFQLYNQARHEGHALKTAVECIYCWVSSQAPSTATYGFYGTRTSEIYILLKGKKGYQTYTNGKLFSKEDLYQIQQGLNTST